MRGSRVLLLGGRSVRAPGTGLILAITRPGVRARWGMVDGEGWETRPERPRHAPLSYPRPPRAPPGGWILGRLGRDSWLVGEDRASWRSEFLDWDEATHLGSGQGMGRIQETDFGLASGELSSGARDVASRAGEDWSGTG